MPDDRDMQMAYCRKHMLPIWEHWADGNLAARRLLECESPDPNSHEERLRQLLDATRLLDDRAGDVTVKAALDAAKAICNGYIGVPPERFLTVCVHAINADAEANRYAR